MHYARLRLVTSATMVAPLASLVLLSCATIRAETITNTYGNGGVRLFNLTLNVGDSVVWIGGFSSSNSIQSYDGTFKSPLLGPGDPFAYTFTNPGSYVYRTRDPSPSGASFPCGVVRVRDSAPSPVTINAPADGSIFGVPLWFQPLVIYASVANATNVTRVQFLANATLIGAVTNPPYVLQWSNVTQGSYALIAEAVDDQEVTTQSEPVSVRIGPYETLWGATGLPGGRIMFFCNPLPSGRSYIYTTTALQPFGFYWNAVSGVIGSPGLFVDEAAPGQPVKFYLLHY